MSWKELLVIILAVVIVLKIEFYLRVWWYKRRKKPAAPPEGPPVVYATVKNSAEPVVCECCHQRVKSYVEYVNHAKWCLVCNEFERR